MGPAITLQNARDLIPDREALKELEAKKEVAYKIEKGVAVENDPLIDIEIAIRKIERLGELKN